MELSTYFEPVNPQYLQFPFDSQMPSLGQCTNIYAQGQPFPNIEKARIALVGVTDDRMSPDNKGCALAPDAIRSMLYPLTAPVDGLQMVDLGNLVPGNTADDTIYALSEIMYKLIERHIVVIILGGSQALTFAQYKAYEILGRIITLLSIDSRVDILDGPLSSHTYINQIVQQKPNYLFDHVSLGYQSYFCHHRLLNLIDDLQFDAYRVGEIQQHIDKAEPTIRRADAISIDISAIRQSDAPAQSHPSPHGFFSHEICQLARYAGMSDKLTSIGFYELNPQFDSNHQTAHAVAHALWYFIEGVYNRRDDAPYGDPKFYQRYCVTLSDEGLEVLFYKSRKTDRWWMEVPDHRHQKDPRFLRQLLIPCSYDDYLEALQNKLPELWWKFYKRYNM